MSGWHELRKLLDEPKPRTDKDLEKSAQLARLAGWQLSERVEEEDDTYCVGVILDRYGKELDIADVEYIPQPVWGFPDLYDKQNMGLAWLIVYWAKEQDRGTDGFVAEAFDMWLHDLPGLWGHPLAQRMWLDKVLELAKEFGVPVPEAQPVIGVKE